MWEDTGVRLNKTRIRFNKQQQQNKPTCIRNLGLPPLHQRHRPPPSSRSPRATTASPPTPARRSPYAGRLRPQPSHIRWFVRYTAPSVVGYRGLDITPPAEIEEPLAFLWEPLWVDPASDTELRRSYAHTRSCVGPHHGRHGGRLRAPPTGPPTCSQP